MRAHDKSVVRAFGWCLFALVVAAPSRSAFAQPPAGTALKTRIMRWEDAKSNSADWGEMRRYFGGQTSATKDVLVAVAVVQPGKSVHKAHRHAEEEYLALVEGSGTWSVDGKESPAQRGDILYAAPWVYHGLTNTGDQPLIFLVVRYNGKGVQPQPQPDDRPNELTDQAGANRPASRRMAKATGTVTLKGRPLANAVVSFVPEQGRPAVGTTDAQGKFSVSTFRKNDGALPGRYRVSITGQAGPANQQPAGRNDQPAVAKPAIPAQYTNPDTSAMWAEITGGPNEFRFDLP